MWGRTSEILARPNPYDQIHRWFPGKKFARVLVIGAGNGLDVASPDLAKGAEHVDAVEIDPFIARIGQELHPDKPYASDKVELTIDDGRNFLRRTDRKYET